MFKKVIATIALTTAASATLAAPNQVPVPSLGINQGGFFDVTDNVPATGFCTGIVARSTHVAEGVTVQHICDIMDMHLNTFSKDNEIQNNFYNSTVGQIGHAVSQIRTNAPYVNQAEAAGYATYIESVNTIASLEAQISANRTELTTLSRTRFDTYNEYLAVQSSTHSALLADQASQITYETRRRDEAQALRDTRPTIPRNQCGQLLYQHQDLCRQAWDGFFAARANFYATFGGHTNLLGHIAEANAEIAAQNARNIPNEVRESEAVQGALAAYQAAAVAESTESPVLTAQINDANSQISTIRSNAQFMAFNAVYGS